ncbi:MAG TPA: c(7)-type cytochrome triheme domain-containing protein [Anaeromyxobacter sp.]
MTSWKLALAAALLAAGTALAGDLPRLPLALELPQSADSPGVVTFDHDQHVDTSRPDCVACHPRLFGILGRSAARRTQVVTHAAMEKGRACGACHGKAALNFEDCSMCHKM